MFAQLLFGLWKFVTRHSFFQNSPCRCQSVCRNCSPKSYSVFKHSSPKCHFGKSASGKLHLWVVSSKGRLRNDASHGSARLQSCWEDVRHNPYAIVFRASPVDKASGSCVRQGENPAGLTLTKDDKGFVFNNETQARGFVFDKLAGFCLGIRHPGVIRSLEIVRPSVFRSGEKSAPECLFGLLKFVTRVSFVLSESPPRCQTVEYQLQMSRISKQTSRICCKH